jgi:protein phosphatase PTC7
MAQGMGRSPTFVVGSDRQRGTLDALVKREQHFSESFQKNKPLCFNAKAYQKTHPQKAVKGQKDADATLCSPMLVAVADGVSQIEDFGIDASELPNELLNAVEELAVSQLLPGQETEEYCGPISMVRDAYEATEALGSTTLLTAVMDNSTKIHGKLHPMIAVCSIGDCEILILRRDSMSQLQPVFHTEMQRIDGNAQSPLQLARVDDSIDPDFDESIAIEVIERGSAVHCVSAFEGDIVVMGSDGVFDNLFIDELLAIVQSMVPTGALGAKFQPIDRRILGQIAHRIVMESHAKTQPGPAGYRDSPIGKGGKIDDTSCVVAQVVEWTEEYGEAWEKVRSKRMWHNLLTCGAGQFDRHEVEEEYENRARNYPSKPNANSFSTYAGSFSAYTSGIEPPMRPDRDIRQMRKEQRRARQSEEGGCSMM